MRRRERGGERRGLIHRVHAAGVARGCARHERAVERYKRSLLASLSGTVVEIGPGAGVNLPYYPPGVRWIGIEPNLHMHPYVRAEADRLGMTVDLRSGTAEHIDLPPASVDAVVSTLVLCSVSNVERVLSEAHRVLREGGRFVFIEHVAAPAGSWKRRLQRILRPAWRLLGDGCHPDRETTRFIRRAGFASIELEAFRVPLPVVSQHIAGVAVR